MSTLGWRSDTKYQLLSPKSNGEGFNLMTDTDGSLPFSIPNTTSLLQLQQRDMAEDQLTRGPRKPQTARLNTAQLNTGGLSNTVNADNGPFVSGQSNSAFDSPDKVRVMWNYYSDRKNVYFILK